MLKDFLYIFLFFTTWNFIFVILHKFTHKYINLLYTSFVSVLVGLYLSFINPRKFIFYYNNKKIIFNNWRKFIVVDLIFHISIFIFIYYKYLSYYKTLSKYKENVLLLITSCIMLLYISFINIKKMYGITSLELLTVFCITNLIYFILF